MNEGRRNDDGLRNRQPRWSSLSERGCGLGIGNQLARLQLATYLQPPIPTLRQPQKYILNQSKWLKQVRLNTHEEFHPVLELPRAPTSQSGVRRRRRAGPTHILSTKVAFEANGHPMVFEDAGVKLSSLCTPATLGLKGSELGDQDSGLAVYRKIVSIITG
jgi:hypothetical protein